jgi:hypothetical protein
MPAPVFTPKELTWLGIAKETAWGTAVNPAYFLPFKDAKPEDVIDYVKDEGIRGAMAMTYNVIPGVAHGTFEIDGQVFPDSFGLLVLSILGQDTVTGTGPYTHAMALSRTGQPPSITPTFYDGTSIRQWPGTVAEELGIKWSSGGPLEYTWKGQGKPSTTATGITPSPGSTVPFLGWEFTATLGGTTKLNLVGFDISLKRKLYVQHAANNTQQPTAIVAGGLAVTGKATFDKADDAELNAYLQNTQPSFVLTGQQNANTQLIIQMTRCAFVKDPVTAKEVVQGDVEFEGVDNDTDGGPCLIKLINAVASY